MTSQRRSPAALVSALSVAALVLLAGCGLIRPAADAGATNGLNGKQPLPPSPSPFQPRAITRTPAPITVWLSPALPEALRQPLGGLDQAGGRKILRVEDPAAALVRVGPQPEITLATWIYALVAPFPTVRDGLSLAEVRAAWSGSAPDLGAMLAAPATVAALSPILEPGVEAAVRSTPEADLLDQAWASRPSLAVVPFEALQPRWKVLEVDGASPVRKTFDPSAYPLAVHFGLSGDPSAVASLRQALIWPATNRDPGKLTTLMMTGVTALTRATAWMMDLKGVLSPAARIGEWLREADVTHVSNEVAFSPTCPRPSPDLTRLRFCSPAEDIGLLDAIGVRVVELTGNHVLDWGDAALLYTLDLYHQRGWSHFGGGADLEDSMRPALVEHNGNRLAFLGCNPAGPPDDWATATSPGSTPCDTARLFAELAQLRAAGYVTIFTYQWNEAYRSTPTPEQVKGFRQAADAGAAIVSGSQAHQPQGFEFYQGSFIHYGPGNLFFDQMFSKETRQEFLDRYVIYAGRHISTELLTAYLEDFSQPRPMTAEERAAFLAEMFSDSGW